MQDAVEPDLDGYFARHFRVVVPALDAGADVNDIYEMGSQIVFDLAANMEQPARRIFVLHGIDRYNELWAEWNADDARFRRKYGIASLQTESASPERRKQNTGYVGRTAIRAVVWNAVNSIFRTFR